jgi:hypothetical protein
MKIPISALLAQKDPTVRSVPITASAHDAAAAMAASLPETPQRAYDLVFGGNGS